MNITNFQISPDSFTPVENLTFEPLEKKYVRVCVLTFVFSYVALMVAALMPLLFDELPYRIVLVVGGESLLALTMAVNLLLLPKIYACKGYALREHDISYRSGIIFPSVVTVPFTKVQQVSLRQTPFSRMFNLYAVDINNGSQSAIRQMVIPGLTKERAERIKSLLIAKANETDR